MEDKLLIRLFSILLLALLISNTPDVSAVASTADANLKVENQNECAGCVVGVTIVKQYATANHITYKKAIDGICALVFHAHPVAKTACDKGLKIWGHKLLAELEAGHDPDQACLNVGYCDQPQCRLWSKSETKPRVQSFGKLGEDFLSWILKRLHVESLTVEHVPYDDSDKDLHASKKQQLRGSHWRGADCNDKDGLVHPGLREYDAKDRNCNGIKGLDATKKLIESELCPNTLETVVIGDSMAAHFSFPPQYLNGRWYKNTTFDNLLSLAENEFDLPYLSWWTGFEERTNSDEVFLSTNYFERRPGSKYERYFDDETEWQHARNIPTAADNQPSNSLYLQYLKRNKCAHRQYQNCGVNGAKMVDDDASGLLQGMSSDINADLPKLVILEFMGNDICKANMTTVADFRTGLLNKLNKLNTVLPNGSHVLISGMFAFDLHYVMLHNHTHPIGVTYSQLYDYLNCLDISPCPMLMNSDPDVRAAGVKRGNELNQVAADLVATRKYTNFDFDFVEFPILEVMDTYRSLGGKNVANMFEPSDGFHGNTFAMKLLSEHVFAKVSAKHPDWFPINPHNDEITKMFGDQGGWYELK